MYPERSTRLRCLLPTRVLILLTLVMAAATTFVGTPTARAANVTCTGVMSGDASGPLNINGNVTVPNGANCTLSFVTVTGNVQANQGSTLLINGYTEPSTIGGNVQAEKCYSALLEGNVTVGGNVQIEQCNGNGPNGFQGPDIVINGNFHCEGNSSSAPSCLAWLGKVNGNVEIQQNHGTAPDVSLVTVGGNLICMQNSSAPTHLHGPSWVDGNSLIQCNGFATATTSISNGPVSPAESCAALASLPASGFPVPNTVITSAVDTPASTTPTFLPERCIVNGYVNNHVSPVDTCTYQDVFQVQLPLASAWNGRFMMQGGGGTEGSVPAATGTIGGTTGITEVSNGYAIASQNGGHQNTDLAACAATNPNTHGNAFQFFLDPLGNLGEVYQSIEVTALTAKYLINQYYGNGPNRSYWVGCSDGGRQGMVMSQHFPSFFDGIVAGDPAYNGQLMSTTEIYGIEQILDVYLSNPALTPPGPTMIAQNAPQASEPHLYPAFPISDQALFETALLQACDALDGVTDGVVDDVQACLAKFNPLTATYIDYAGALGPLNTTYALQCTGAKNATCLSPAQIQAAILINQGPRSNGSVVLSPAGALAPDHVSNVVPGYQYDGGWMTTASIPARKIGTSSATSVPGDFGSNTASQFPYAFISPPNPPYYPLSFNFSTDLGLLSPNVPITTYSTSLDIGHFVNYGHKIIFYHGASDPGPPILGTQVYYQEMASQFGGFQAAQNFSRFYTIPNMGHCNGGATTDGFDFLTPLMNWVENSTSPNAVVAKGTNFNATNYQTVGNYITGTFVNAPTTRNRPLCPFPQQARFVGSTTIVNGVPVASNPTDLANASNYTCIQPPEGMPPLPPH